MQARRGQTHWSCPYDRANVDYGHVKSIALAAAGRLTLCDFRGVFEHDADVLKQPWYVRL